MDYDKDLAPAFGDKFRLVYETLPGTTTGSGSTVDAYTVITLADPVKMKNSMDF